ncbi:metal-sulfur cluster assembly factor [Zobellella sp. DQSA1]|uniref:metal-sulfur cluster assembly factor n=1 Tax=Zobellella sp. DQSA1 TaxID=3342386 RepID=UPI0035BFD36C
MVTEQQVRDALCRVLDPEVGENIIELGLVYGIEITAQRLAVVMTMTSPSCPMGDWIRQQVEAEIKTLCQDGQRAEVELVWQPAWGPERMSPTLRARLGWA